MFCSTSCVVLEKASSMFLQHKHSSIVVQYKESSMFCCRNIYIAAWGIIIH